MRILPALAAMSLVSFVAIGCSTQAEQAGAPGAAPPQAQAPAPDPERGGAAGPKAATAKPVQALEKKQFGSPITEKTPTPLMDLVRDPSKHAGKTVRTEGVVTAVCQRAGCWMEIGDETGTIHVKMAGHSFFVPKDCSGQRAVVQGTVQPTMTDTCGDEDGCRANAERASGRVASLELEAAGVQFVD